MGPSLATTFPGVIPPAAPIAPHAYAGDPESVRAPASHPAQLASAPRPPSAMRGMPHAPRPPPPAPARAPAGAARQLVREESPGLSSLG